MLELHFTDAQRLAGEITPQQLHQAVQAVREDGVVILHNVIDVAHIDKIYQRMVADLPLVESHPKKGQPGGYAYLSPVREREYLFKDVLTNAIAAKVMGGVMGEAVTCGAYTANTNMPGSELQFTHFDPGARGKDSGPLDFPCNCMAMNIPLIDFTPENGATWIWPGTQFTEGREVGSMGITQAAMDERRKIKPPVQAVIPKGSIFLRDFRLWHSAGANRTDQIRIMIGMILNGGYKPGIDPIEGRIACAGDFPTSAREIFENAPIHYNVRYTDGPIDHLWTPKNK